MEKMSANDYSRFEEKSNPAIYCYILSNLRPTNHLDLNEIMIMMLLPATAIIQGHGDGDA